MFSNLTLTSIFWIFLGLCLAGFGSYLGYQKRYMIYYMMPLVLGIVFLGLGSILCGITNGFTDYTPTGRLLGKIGGVLLIVGLGLTVYGGYKFV